MNSQLPSSNSLINLTLDLSTLGSGYQFNQKAGIFRYSYDLTCALLASEKCNISLCSSASFELLLWTKRFLKTDYHLSQQPFIIHPSLQKNWRSKDQYSTFIEKLIKTIHNLGFTKTKILKEVLIDLARPKSTLLDLGSLKKQDIYHSFYYAIPPEITNLKVKQFVTIHDLIPILYPQFFIKPIREKFLQIINSLDSSMWITCVSESTKRDLCNYRSDLDPEKIFVIYPAASKDFYPCPSKTIIDDTKKKYGIPSSPYILSLSTLEIRKNISHLIRCFSKLISQQKIDDLYLVLAGQKGWLDHDIYHAIHNLDSQLSTRIIFTGYIAQEDLAPLYSGALMFAYPSLYEGFGLPPLEAMQCGTPVITSNTSSLPEVVGAAGLTVDPGDEDELSQSILNIYQDTSLHHSLSIKSVQQAAKFSWLKCAAQTVSAYQCALAN